MIRKPNQPLDELERAAATFARPVPPTLAVVLGSGLGDFVDALADPCATPYSELDWMPKSSVAGHAGRFVFGSLGETRLVVMQGRVHLYEGYSAAQVVLGVRVMHALGARTLIVTNAAGALNTDFSPGDLMLIRDQINLSGTSPLAYPDAELYGERFVDMSQAYDRELLRLAVECAQRESLPIRQGVYLGLRGPQYETPAEVRMLRELGADVVGMSTVLEVIAARQLGMRTLGISCVTNAAAGLSASGLSHEEVQQEARSSGKALTRLIRNVVERSAVNSA